MACPGGSSCRKPRRQGGIFVYGDDPATRLHTHYSRRVAWRRRRKRWEAKAHALPRLYVGLIVVATGAALAALLR